MSWWRREEFTGRVPNLLQRAEMLRNIRDFLSERGYLEVETSPLQVSPGMEVHIKAFETVLFSADRQTKTRKFLHTSPELAMKKLLVAGLPKIFQTCQVFRNAESSELHSPSFTMLEWYQAGLDYSGLMDETVDLIRFVSKKSLSWRGLVSDPQDDWQKISVCYAFKHYADIDLEEILDDRDSFVLEAARLGVTVDSKASWDDIFFAIFLEKIESHLGHPVPTILYDYPASMAALARIKPKNKKFAERFEVYICGMELANAFGELTEASVQQDRFEKAMLEKNRIYGENYPVDEDFIKALEYGMPSASGIALGIDRLAMLLCGAEDIKQVQAWG